LPDTVAPFRYRRAADFTALRLGRAVLGYLGVVVGVITLAPFRFQSTPAHGLSFVWTWSDLVLNVLMFVPFGFVYQLTRPRGAAPDRWRVLLLGLALSGIIETVQLFAPMRHTSVLDLATNTAGALLGAWAFAGLSQRVRGETAVQTLALELPLMGLVYLLIPLCWLIGFGSDGELRTLLLLGPGLVAGAILGTVHAAYVRPSPPAWWLPATCLSWSIVAFVPGAKGDFMVVLPGALLVLAVAVLRDLATRRAVRRSAPETNRRFELPTLRRVLPVYTVYLVLSALWPLDDADGRWRATFALSLAEVELTQQAVFRALEQVAAFTLVGYMGAEYHGRDPRAGVPTLARIIAWSVMASALLQVARGFQPAAGASLALFLLTQVAAAFGHLLYVLQRDHVQALVQRRTLLASFRRAAGIPTVAGDG
jgi:glycopeptide antibiotics resistance protein